MIANFIFGEVVSLLRYYVKNGSVFFFVTIFCVVANKQIDVMPSLWGVIHREEKSMDWTHTNDSINKDSFSWKIGCETKITLQIQ